MKEALDTTFRKECSDQVKSGEKISDGGEALEQVHQRDCSGTKMWPDPHQSDLTSKLVLI